MWFNTMYCLNDLCCICLYKKDKLQNLSAIDSDEITYYGKLISCIPEMCFKEMNDQRLSCSECFNTIDTLYKFRKNCLKNKLILIDYFSKHSTSNENVHTSDCLTDINNIKVKYENEFENHESIGEKYELKSTIKSIDEDDKKCNEIYFENVVIPENETIDVKLIENKHNFNELNISEIKMEKSYDDDVSDNDDEIEQDYLPEENSHNPLETQDFNPDKKTDSFHEATKKNQKALKHKIISSEIKPYECHICKREFNQQSDFSKHMRIHIGGKPHQCNICKKKFTQLCSLTKHKRIHTVEKKHECNICNKRFIYSSHLMRHMRIHSEKLHECSVCQKKFSYSFDLNKHKQIHTGEKPYECSVCQKKFIQSTHLTTHMRVHTREKPHACSVCKKKFSFSAQLSRHMITHTGQNPYECSVCNKKFSQSSSVTSHMRIHTGARPHECSVCNKTFSVATNLIRHIRIHTGEKPYECGICNTKFTQSSILNRHMKTHSE